MAFPTKYILIIFDEVLIFVKDPTDSFENIQLQNFMFKF